MSGTKRRFDEELYSLGLLVIGILVISAVLMILVRIQRGLLGFVLAGITILLIAYWLNEIRKTIKSEMTPSIAKSKKWVYDIIDEQDSITFVAEVPGPEDQIKVELQERTLKICGGQEFVREVKLPKPAEIIESKYLNGVLNIRLRKVT
ncbi:MAG: Hsp20/alpha crystallin family protein [Nitrososphaerota archaeon]